MTEQKSEATRTLSYRAALREALIEEMERDERVFMMGQDAGPFGGVFGVSKGLTEMFGADRVFDTPISEAFIVGGGVGAALAGARPVVELQYADFALISMDEIVNKAAKWRYMHGGGQAVPLVIRAPEGVVGGLGPDSVDCQQLGTQLLGLPHTPGGEVVRVMRQICQHGLQLEDLRVEIATGADQRR